MPIRPPPTAYRCPRCGWSKTVAPRSDALMPGEFFDACPVCGNPRLTRQAPAPSPLGALATALRGILRHR